MLILMAISLISPVRPLFGALDPRLAVDGHHNLAGLYVDTGTEHSLLHQETDILQTEHFCLDASVVAR